MKVHLNLHPHLAWNDLQLAMEDTPVERAKRGKVLIIKDVGSLIITIRNQKVIVDCDLAEIYGVETRRLNEQVKRNPERFPEDFMFQLTKEEADV